MLQDDGGAVITEIIVVSYAMHHSRQWGHNRGTCGQPHVYAQVQRAGLRDRARPKMLAAPVNNAVLEVAAYADAGVFFGQQGIDQLLVSRGVAQVGGVNLGIGGREIEAGDGRSVEVDGQDRAELGLVLLKNESERQKRWNESGQ